MLVVKHWVSRWPSFLPHMHQERGSHDPTEKQAGHRNSKTAHSLPQEPPEKTREEEANYIFLLLNMCSAQKQWAQAPGEINILIQVSHTNEGSHCHGLGMLTTRNDPFQGGKGANE